MVETKKPLVRDEVNLDNEMEMAEYIKRASKLSPENSGAFALFEMYTDFREQIRQMAVAQISASSEPADIKAGLLSDLAIRHAMERAEELCIGTAFPLPVPRRYTPEEVRQMENLQHLRKLARLRIFQRCLRERGKAGEAMLKEAMADEAKLRADLKKEGIILPA